ncbi:MAG: hypothetical protein ABIU18_04815 [Novosphingobium sp.]
MSMHFRELAEQAMIDGRVSAAEVLSLRREGWRDGAIAPDEAEALFVLNNHVNEPSAEWTDAFVEALVEHMIAGGSPRGYVSQGQADWLVAQIDSDGRVESEAELELLAKLFERAAAVPESLKAYALHQVEQAVLTGARPTRDGGALVAGQISESECRLLRRFIFAGGGDRPGAVSQNEAEMLFRIKDASLGANNAAQWPLLFVQGVSNYLQGWSSGNVIDGSRAQQLETFMNDAAPSVGRFFARMASSTVSGGVSKALGFGRKGASDPDIAERVARDAEVTPMENAWLQAKFAADGKMDELEHALAVFLRNEPVRPGV